MVVLVPRGGGAAAFVKRGGGVPGPPYGLFLFFGLPRVKVQGALRGGAAGLSCGLAARDGQKRASRAHGALADRYSPARCKVNCFF